MIQRISPDNLSRRAIGFIIQSRTYRSCGHFKLRCYLFLQLCACFNESFLFCHCISVF
nr:MAG TPA: hypothetical protein [Caudoviricetes sp.]